MNKILGLTLATSIVLSFSSIAFAGDSIVKENEEHTFYNTATFEGGIAPRSGEKISSEVELNSRGDLYNPAPWYAEGWVNVVDRQYLPITHYTNATVESGDSSNSGTRYAESGRIWGNGKVSATSENTYNWGYARIYYGW